MPAHTHPECRTVSTAVDAMLQSSDRVGCLDWRLGFPYSTYTDNSDPEFHGGMCVNTYNSSTRSGRAFSNPRHLVVVKGDPGVCVGVGADEATYGIEAVEFSTDGTIQRIDLHGLTTCPDSPYIAVVYVNF